MKWCFSVWLITSVPFVPSWLVAQVSFIEISPQDGVIRFLCTCCIQNTSWIVIFIQPLSSISQVHKEQMVGLDLYPAQLICIVIGDMSMKSDGLSKWKLEKRDHLEINSIYMILFYVVKTINRWHCQKKSILPAANTQTYEADLVILRVLQLDNKTFTSADRMVLIRNALGWKLPECEQYQSRWQNLYRLKKRKKDARRWKRFLEEKQRRLPTKEINDDDWEAVTM